MSRGRKQKEYSINEIYDQYVALYKKRATRLAKKGLKPQNKMTSKRNKADIKQAVYDIREGMKLEGKKFSLASALSGIVNEEIYKLNSSTVDSVVTFFKLKGIKIDRDELRTLGIKQVLTAEHYAIIQELYDYLETSGLTGTEAKDYISKYIFGSD